MVFEYYCCGLVCPLLCLYLAAFMQGRTNVVENSANVTYLNTAALLALGISLLGHAMLNTWSLFRVSETMPCFLVLEPISYNDRCITHRSDKT